MEMKELLNQLPTEQERKDLLVQALNAAIPYLQKEDQAQKVQELEKANQELNARLEKAKEYFAENKGAVQQAEKRAAAVMARNLQKTRDELYVIGNTLHDYALALGEKASAKLTLVQVNNLLGYVQEIIQNLRENGLWNDETDVMPELNIVEKAKKPRTTKKKKAEEQQLEENAESPESQVQPDGDSQELSDDQRQHAEEALESSNIQLQIAEEVQESSGEQPQNAEESQENTNVQLQISEEAPESSNEPPLEQQSSPLSDQMQE